MESRISTTFRVSNIHILFKRFNIDVCFRNLNETSLQNLRGNLHLHLYDETVSDLMEDDRLRQTNIHQQLGCNWLGGIHFPISTLLYNKRVSFFHTIH